MTKIYTKTGDEGKTKDCLGNVISKDSCLISIQGKIDSLLASMDSIIANHPFKGDPDIKKLDIIEKKLWQLAGELAIGSIDHPRMINPINEEDVTFLEKEIDSMNVNLSGFIRFQTLLPSLINESRVRCRDLERELTTYLNSSKVRPVSYKYINRLSDYFFALGYKYVKHDQLMR